MLRMLVPLKKVLTTTSEKNRESNKKLKPVSKTGKQTVASRLQRLLPTLHEFLQQKKKETL